MPDQKPNILFIMSDDIGWFNASCYNNGVEFPPRAKSASFSIDQIMEQMMPKEVGMEQKESFGKSTETTKASKTSKVKAT